MNSAAFKFEGEKLKIDLEVKDGVGHLNFYGDIDEDFSADMILSHKLKSFVVNLENIKMINSCGIREWINFLDKAGSDSKFRYVKCPQVIIQQMNIVDGFLSKNAVVESFYAPYYNEQEDEEVVKLINTVDIKDGKAPKFTDDKSGAELEFDAIEKQYFNFINIQNKNKG